MPTEVADHVFIYTEEELRERLKEARAYLERRFGTIERACEHEDSWNYEGDDAYWFSEYRSLLFLLDEEADR